MRRLAPLALLLSLAPLGPLTLACSRAPANARPDRARARAPFDVHAQPGALVELQAGCDSCKGEPTFRWSVAVAPATGPDCQLSPAEAARLDVKCPAEGLWVFRLDVDDDRGEGQPDYVNVTYSLAAPGGSTASTSEGSTSAGSTAAGSSAGSTSAGSTTGGASSGAASSSSSSSSSSSASSNSSSGTTSTSSGATSSSSSSASSSATSSSSGGGTTASSSSSSSSSAASSSSGGSSGGLISGTLLLTEPDGATPVTDAVPGDLIEAHASAFVVPGTLACSFTVTGGAARTPTSGTGCDVPIYPLDSGTYTVTVTFSSLGMSGTASATVTVHDFASTSVFSTTIAGVAADPLSGQVAVAKANEHLMYDPATDTDVPTALTNSRDGLCADALGGESVIGATSNGVAGYDTRSSSPYEDTTTLSGDVIAAAMVGKPGATASDPWENISLASDGTTVMVWPDTTAPVTSAHPWRLLAQAVNASLSGLPDNLHASIGAYGVKNDRTLEFSYLSEISAFADGTSSSLAVHSLGAVAAGNSRVTALASGPFDSGTVWLGTEAHGLFGYKNVASSRSTALPSPSTTLSTGGQPVDSLSLVIDGPWAGDVWAVVAGAVRRVSACPNTVNAPPVLLTLAAQPPGTAISVSAGSADPGPSGAPVLWVGTSSGLKRLGPDN